ncbi:placenta-specific gene 8 protein-like [Pomacea canaliculata]|uniref:placenta-specific gene 8 protein-like n=1 Tax=Pomacea canaliculata TaxID=400727 RepID=UPI000D729144|nr:placenta-specific gene 8 protein-like [Pomacea canaliculata]
MAVVRQPKVEMTLLVGLEGHRDWSSGLGSCLEDCSSACFTCWCMPCMLCKLASRMKECFILPCMLPCTFLAMRTKLRTMGDIKGSICKDYCAVTCCTMCTMCQMAREMNYMGL